MREDGHERHDRPDRPHDFREDDDDRGYRESDYQDYRRQRQHFEDRLFNILTALTAQLKNIHTQTHNIQEGQNTIMATVDDLNAAITQLATDLGDAVTRIEAKINAGSTPADLQPEVDQLKAFSATLDSLAADPVTPPTDPPVDPTL